MGLASKVGLVGVIVLPTSPFSTFLSDINFNSSFSLALMATERLEKRVGRRGDKTASLYETTLVLFPALELVTGMEGWIPLFCSIGGVKQMIGDMVGTGDSDRALDFEDDFADDWVARPAEKEALEGRRRGLDDMMAENTILSE